MLSDFHEHPGQLFVAATLLPLASFVLLLLVGGVRQFFRPRRGVDSSGGVLFHLLGGNTPGRSAAFVATGAIGLAFVCSCIGAICFTHDMHQRHEFSHQLGELYGKHAHHDHDEGDKEKAEKDHDEHEHANLDQKIATTRENIDKIDDKWRGRAIWANIGNDAQRRIVDGKAVVSLPRPATILHLGYRIDDLTVIMFLMVTFIATLIHVFSMGYMADELQPIVEDHQVHAAEGHLRRRGRFGRFFLFLSLFCFSMLNLVLADNLFQVFVSWELVGICSYLLIGFYYERQSAANAANKAFITNRVGDAGFILGLMILWTYVGTFNFEDIFTQIRSPVRDSHGGLKLAGQIVRAEPTGERSKISQMIEVTTGSDADTGSMLVLFPRKQVLEHAADIHLHGVDPGKKVRAYDTPDENQYGAMPYWLLVLAGLGIFLGCMGKSAQFPLHVWLPDAMEGPTPVSALIHAATMVAAGVYLVARCYPLFTPESRLVIAYTGAITLFVAATIAVVMTDIKKVLAYSTVSQLGYMMLALGVGGWMAGVFHLLTHAFFKALLFLGSGSVIFGCHHEQDMSKMGGLYPKMKITALTMLVGVLTIAGTPFFSGWYSKDAILAQTLGFVAINKVHVLLFLLPLVTAGITTFYMFRMWFMTFTGEPRDAHVHEHAHESPRTMTVPLILLAFFSVTVAWGWPLHDAEASYLGSRLHHTQPHHVYADFGIMNLEGEPDEHIHWMGGAVKDVKMESARYWAFQYHTLAEVLALLAAATGIAFASMLYYFRALDPEEGKDQFPALHRFLIHKWYFDELYSATLVRPALAVAHWCKNFDLRIIDGAIDGFARAGIRVSKAGGWMDLNIVDGLANLIARVAWWLGDRFRSVQTGYLRSYVLFLVLAAVGLFALLSYFVTLAGAN